MTAHISALVPAPSVNHRANRLLAALEPDDFAALEPHLQGVNLRQDQVLYEAGDPLRHATFPHNTVVSLVAVLKDGRSAEMAVYGREGALGLVSSMMARQSFGRYIVQATGTASRIELERLHEMISLRPKVRQLVLNFSEAMMARVLQNVACNAVHSVEERCCRWILTFTTVWTRTPCRSRMSSWPTCWACSAPPSAPLPEPSRKPG